MASKTRYKSRSPTPAPLNQEGSVSPIPHTSSSSSAPGSTATFSCNLVIGNSAPHSFSASIPQTQYHQSAETRWCSDPAGSPYMPHSSPYPFRHSKISEEQDRYTRTSSIREADYDNFAQSKPLALIDNSSTDSLVSTSSTDTAMPESLPPSAYYHSYSSRNGTPTLPMFMEPTYHNSHLQHMEHAAVAGIKPTPLQPSFPGPQFPSPIMSLDDRHRPRQLSIQSILSSPGLPTQGSACSFGNGHGPGGVKRKKEEEEEGEITLRQEPEKREVKGLEGIEDPDVRLAAEALGDLRADFNNSSAHHSRSSSLNRPIHPNQLHLSTSTSSSSTSNSSTNATSLNSPLSPSSSLPPLSQYSPSLSPTPLSDSHSHISSHQSQQKPLIDLLSESSPIVGAVVQRSAAAYSGTKNYSPKFRYAAEIGEKFVGVSGSYVGKRMGGERLEGWVRSKLGGSADQGLEKDEDENGLDSIQLFNGDLGVNGEQEPVGKKKRKTSTGEVDLSGNINCNGAIRPLIRNGNHPPPPSNWQTRMMITTSGLTVAMSEESFKSLQFCFSWLRAANAHLSKMIETLQQMLADYEASLHSNGPFPSSSSSPSSCSSSSSGENSNSAYSAEQGVLSKVLPERYETQRQKFLKAIETVKEDVLNTIKKVINVVDDYAGGALTGEARSMVKRQLLLLPRRISYVLARSSMGASPAVQGVVKRLAGSAGEGREGVVSDGRSGAAPTANGDLEQDVEKGAQSQMVDPRVNANKVLLIAREGFEMMQNVTRLVEETLVSAEEWCEKLGRRPGGLPSEVGAAAAVASGEIGRREAEKLHGKGRIGEEGWYGQGEDVEMVSVDGLGMRREEKWDRRRSMGVGMDREGDVEMR